MAVTFDNITTTTLQLIRKKLADNIFKANPFSAWMLMRGRVEVENGGKYIQEPLIYATNQTVQSYRGYDRLNVAPTEELTSAQYAWRQAAVSIGISGTEELQNNGAQAVFNLLKAKIKVAEMSLMEQFNTWLLATTSTKDLTRDFLGLDEIVEDVAAGSQGTLGGINRAVETWWANLFTAAGTSISSSTTLLTNRMTTQYHTTKKNHKVAVDLILTTQSLFEKYENDNRTLLRLADTRLLDVGFENLKFKNSVMMWDESIKLAGTDATQYMYMLSTEFLRFVLHAKRNFVLSNFVSPIDQDAKVAQILLAGQLTCSNSRFQHVNIHDNS